MTDAVQLIPLKTARLPTFSKCLTAGWGDVGDNNTLAARLQEVNVTTLPDRTCRRRWRKVPITRTMVCGVGGSDFQGFCSVRSIRYRVGLKAADGNTVDTGTPQGVLLVLHLSSFREILVDRWYVMEPWRVWSPSLAGDVETAGPLMFTCGCHHSVTGLRACSTAMTQTVTDIWCVSEDKANNCKCHCCSYQSENLPSAYPLLLLFSCIVSFLCSVKLWAGSTAHIRWTKELFPTYFAYVYACWNCFSCSLQ